MRQRIFLCVAILALIACTKNKTAQKQNHITIAWDAAPRTIDPRYAVDANSQYLEDLVHCALIDFDQDGKTVGDLAKDWKWKSPTELHVFLKPEAKFNKGQFVTSVDVKSTYDFFQLKDVKEPSARSGAFTNVKKVEAVDAQTVIFHLAEPDSTFVTNLVVGILPSKLASGPMLADPALSISCGPYELNSVQTQRIRLKSNTNYSIDTAPKMDQLVIEIVKDETTRFAKLRKGEVDIIQNSISRDKVADISKRQPELVVLRRAGLNTSYLGFNMTDPILGKLEVRQAIAHAIDRQEIIKYILQGLAIPASSLLPPNDPFFKKSHHYDLDLAMSQKLLDQAGFKDPDGDGPKSRFNIEYKTTTDLTALTIAKAIAAQLSKIGIAVKVQPLDWGKFKADVDQGNIQMWSLSWIGFKDPDIFRYAFSTESFAPNGGNRGRYSNKTLDKLLEKGRRVVGLEDRKKIYDEIQDMVGKELPYVFLWHQENFAITSNKITNFKLFADGRYSSLKETVRQ